MICLGIDTSNYTTSVAVPSLEQMWQGGYNIIANANKVLQELENGRSVVTDDYEYNLIKGELLGIRAYVHFDLLRMFGPSTWLGDNASKLVVPYVRSYSSAPEVQRTVFTLRYFEEMKYSEMSQRLNTSEGSLKASYHIAVKKISEFFKSHD